MTMCNEWMKKGYLETFWNDIHLEEEEMEDLEILGCRRLQRGRQIGKLTT